MALIVNRSDRFPVGTSVGAYPRANRKFGGAPSGEALETHVVNAAGALEYTTIPQGVPYTLYAFVAGEHRYVDVEESTWTAPGDLKERVQAKREEVGT